jgi:formate hydrogenlyase subunit 6/NADH:ubiquinone oxidoreductase subunit I
MPWIDQESCTGCGICVDKCPVDTISMKIEKAEINMAECIRCGICHDVCPQESVRHDSEKVPDMIKANVEMTNKYMALCAKHLGDDKEKVKCLNRMKKHFNSQKIIAEKTLEELVKLKNS